MIQRMGSLRSSLSFNPLPLSPPIHHVIQACKPQNKPCTVLAPSFHVISALPRAPIEHLSCLRSFLASGLPGKIWIGAPYHLLCQIFPSVPKGLTFLFARVPVRAVVLPPAAVSWLVLTRWSFLLVPPCLADRPTRDKLMDYHIKQVFKEMLYVFFLFVWGFLTA